MDKVCKECGKEFASPQSLHKHVKAHNLSLAAYFHKHYPRYDKLNGALIDFKSLEYYLTSDFNSRTNAFQWFKQSDQEIVKAYLIKWLSDLKQRKSLIFGPTQVELRTSWLPGMRYFQALFGKSYNSILSSIGYNVKFPLENFSGQWDSFNSGSKIIIDSRERLPLKFKGIKTVIEGLPFGDYKLANDSMSRHGFIERKAVGDLFGTMTAGYERFQRELDKAKEACAYVVILVEGSFDMIRQYPLQTGGRVQISPEFIFHRVRELIQKYDHIQFLFVNNREDSVKAIKKIFCSQGQYKNIDLQYMYDTGQLV